MKFMLLSMFPRITLSRLPVEFWSSFILDPTNQGLRPSLRLTLSKLVSPIAILYQGLYRGMEDEKEGGC